MSVEPAQEERLSRFREIAVEVERLAKEHGLGSAIVAIATTSGEVLYGDAGHVLMNIGMLTQITVDLSRRGPSVSAQGILEIQAAVAAAGKHAEECPKCGNFGAEQ